MAINKEFLQANHADLVEAFRAEGRTAGFEEGRKAGLEEGRKQGATTERERIAAIDAAAVPGHEKLTAQAKAEGMSAGEYAQRVLAAEKVAREQAMANATLDAPKPASGADAGDKPGTMKRQAFEALPVAERKAKLAAGVQIID